MAPTWILLKIDRSSGTCKSCKHRYCRYGDWCFSKYCGNYRGIVHLPSFNCSQWRLSGCEQHDKVEKVFGKFTLQISLDLREGMKRKTTPFFMFPSGPRHVMVQPPHCNLISLASVPPSRIFEVPLFKGRKGLPHQDQL